MRCAAIRDMLHREAARLDEAQRLVLDDHLAACARCRRDRAHLLGVHRIGAAIEPRLDPRAQQRVIARALLEGPRDLRERPEDRASDRIRPGHRVEGVASLRRRWVPFAALAFAAAALALVIAWQLRAPADTELAELAPPAAPVLAPPPALPGAIDAATPDEIVVEVDDVVEEGTLRTEAGSVATGAQVPVGILVRAPARARVRLASARVVVAASSELRWQPVERTILLERGRLDIAGGPSNTMRVIAGRTEVDVGDADAAIEPGSVRVLRGVVQVRRGATTVRVTAGNAWTLETSPAPTTDELLAEARRKFAAHDYAGAERAAGAALANRPAPAIAASARTLLADIALAASELDRAASRYLAVANDYAGTPVAESALYAAARIELRRSHRDAARALLARYLDRYPTGRYVDDVRRQLAAP